MSKWTKKFDQDKIKEKMKAKENMGRKVFKDDRFWKLDIKDHKGSAVIRFLPDPDTGEFWKKYYQHAFRDNNKWYISNCAYTNGDECPICDKVSEYFASDYESSKELGRQRQRKVKYISNILVIKDSTNPDNNGKVFLFEYKNQIKNMYMEAVYGPKEIPKEELQEMIDNKEINLYIPCDFNKGADFVIRAAPKKIGQDMAHDYSLSKFKPQSALFGDLDDEERDEAIDKVMSAAHKLADVPAKDTFPTADQVRRSHAPILGISSTSTEDVEYEPDTTENDANEETVSDEAITNKRKVVTTADDEDLDDFLDSLDED